MKRGRRVGGGLSDRKLAEDRLEPVVSPLDTAEEIEVISWRELPFSEMTEVQVERWFTELIELVMLDEAEEVEH